jgi:hypothetical protein
MGGLTNQPPLHMHHTADSCKISQSRVKAQTYVRLTPDEHLCYYKHSLPLQISVVASCDLYTQTGGRENCNLKRRISYEYLSGSKSLALKFMSLWSRVFLKKLTLPQLIKILHCSVGGTVHYRIYNSPPVPLFRVQ